MKPLVAIVGETASGKTALAIDLASRFNGEIICADSATVRRGADIGSAKPSAKERAAVPHHLLDVVGPDERFTVADFQRLANQAIDDITWRGKLPIMVGGTGLYVDSVLYNYQFGVDNAPDRQHMRDNSLVMGIQLDRELLKQKIAARLDSMLAAGLEAEVKALADEYGWDCLTLKNVGYAQWKGYFDGLEKLAGTRQQIIKANTDLAKRQRTWFKRNKSIHWLSTPVNLAEVVELVTTFLSTDNSKAG